MRLAAQIIITQESAKSIKALEMLKNNQKIVEIITPFVAEELERLEQNSGGNPQLAQRIVTKKENFVIDDAKLAIEKAYIASDVEKFIVLASDRFSTDVQNKLLKVIEEPPPKVSFVLITPSKSALLPTIRSRLPIEQIRAPKETVISSLNMRELDLKSAYEFIQTKKYLSTTEAKALVEQIATDAMRTGRYTLDRSTLKVIENSYRALDVGSPPNFVLTTLLLKLLAKRH